MPPHIVRYPPIQCNTRERCDQLQIPAPPPAWRVPEGPDNLAAAPMGGGRAWPGFEGKLHHTQRHKRRRCGGRRRVRRARAGFEIDHSEPQARVWRSRGRPDPTAPEHQRCHKRQNSKAWAPEGQAAEPVGGGGAWPGFETTRRAKLAARTASGRAGPAAVGDQAGGRARRRPEHQRSTPSTARWEAAARPSGPGPTGAEGARNTSGAHQVPPDGRLPQPRRCEGRRRTGLRCPWVAAGPGRASRRRAEPKARGADGERAGRRPRAHKAARRANCLYSPPTPGSGRPV